MKKLIAFILILAVIIVGCKQNIPEKIVGGCGTVTPGYNDACCEQNNKDTPHIMCVGSWKFNFEKAKCEFACDVEVQ